MSRFRLLLLAALALFLPSLARGEAQASRPPNVLFAIADDWGFGHASAYGCAWVRTPGFDRVAREGLLFTRAYTPNAKCAPSRAVLLTGRESWQLEEAANHWCFFPPKFRTYPEALGANGYTVGSTGKGWGPGIAKDAAGNPRQLVGPPHGRRTAPPPARAVANNDYSGNFEEFLQAAPMEKPWCFWYGGQEPHRAYEFGAGVAKGGKKLTDVDRVPGYLPDNETVRNDLLDYAFEVEHFDRHLVRMLELLERRGELDNTLVVVTSDHGMPFPRVKGQAYEFSNHVPLAIRWPKGIVHPGRTVDRFVSFTGMAPTFVELAGLKWEQTGMQPAAGRSFTDLLRDAPAADAPRDHMLVGKERHDVGRPHDWGYPIRGLLEKGRLYLHNFEPTRWPAGNPETGYLNCDGGPTKTEVLEARRKAGKDARWSLCFGKRPQEELYDLAKDPDCMVNLVAQPGREAETKALKDRLFAELRAQEDPRMFGKGRLFDEYPYADPDGRGFYERFMAGEKPKAGWVSETDFEKGPLDD